MEESTRIELNSIKSELQSIINELDSIANGVRYDFTGIESYRCADCISNVANKYRNVKRTLNSIN